jgi:hypothetical protein
VEFGFEQGCVRSRVVIGGADLGVGNFREGTPQHIEPWMQADVYERSKPSVRVSSVVDSVGFGITQDPNPAFLTCKNSGRAGNFTQICHESYNQINHFDPSSSLTLGRVLTTTDKRRSNHEQSGNRT